MDIVVCASCKKQKSLDQFSPANRPPSRHHRCKACVAESDKRRYLNDPELHRKKAREQRQSQNLIIKQYVLDYLKAHPCVDCGESDPIVLQFDHITDDKKANISHLRNIGSSLKRLQAEIVKCRVRCANCHTRRTALEQNWYSGLQL